MAATKTSRRSSAASARPIASNARGTAGGKARTTVVKGAKVSTAGKSNAASKSTPAKKSAPAGKGAAKPKSKEALTTGLKVVRVAGRGAGTTGKSAAAASKAKTGKKSASVRSGAKVVDVKTGVSSAVGASHLKPAVMVEAKPQAVPAKPLGPTTLVSSAPAFVRKPLVIAGLDINEVVDESRSFFESHGLVSLSRAIPYLCLVPKPDEERIEEALNEGLTRAFVFPGFTSQKMALLEMAKALATAPVATLETKHQYTAPWVQEPMVMSKAKIVNRPTGPYLMLFSPEGIQPETRGLTGSQLRKLLLERKRASMTAFEYLILQRQSAIAFGDHRFDDNTAPGDACQWMWLPDSTTERGYTTGNWNPARRRVELGCCAEGAANPRKGAHLTMIVPLE